MEFKRNKSIGEICKAVKPCEGKKKFDEKLLIPSIEIESPNVIPIKSMYRIDSRDWDKIGEEKVLDSVKKELFNNLLPYIKTDVEYHPMEMQTYIKATIRIVE